MRLKSLEIKGFKSFANDTVIHFNERVTGVVGPNGSGKSNIVDAIRWVLGDQSTKELRLDKMSSVIFNGSKKRKPAGMASVTITFDNTRNLIPTEYNTVSISRILYRSGDSEYKINGTTCRLKDIQSLLMDTGIGSDSYAIIALGMVDDILSDKENSRRRMLEQAAGISKYKVRKKETLNKLKSTTEDLERVKDLLYEIEKNMKMLERQAKRAEKYLEIKSEYREKSIELAGYKTNDYQKKISDIQSKIQSELDAFSKIETQISVVEAQLEKQKLDSLEKEKNLSEAQKEINHLTGSIRSMENDRRMLTQESEFTSENIVNLTNEMKSLKFRSEQLLEEIEDYNERLVDAEEQEEVHKTQVAEYEVQVQLIRNEYNGMQDGMQKIFKQQSDTEKKLYEIEKNIAINNNQIINARSEINRNQKDLESKALEIQSWQTRSGDAEAIVTQIADKLKTLEEDEVNRQQNIDELNVKIESLEKDLHSNNRALDAKKNEYKLTKSMIDSMEGFPESIRFLSKNMNWGDDVPLLSDAFFITDNEKRGAVEAFLEPYLNYYVVDNTEMAMKAIEKLTIAQKGKANFFILDQIQPPQSSSTNHQYTTLMSLVEADEKYFNLLAHLLEDVVLVPADEIGSKEIHQLHFNAVVSEDGRIISRKERMSGGSLGLFEGKKIGRKKNLTLLNNEIEELEIKVQELNKTLKDWGQHRSELRGKNNANLVQQLRKELQTKENDFIQLKTRLENATDLIKVLEGKQDDVNEKILMYQEENVDLNEDLIEIKNQLQSIKSKLEAEDSVVKEKADKLTEINQLFNSVRIEFIKQQNLCESLKKEIGFRRAQITDVEKKIQTSEITITEKTQRLNLISTQVHEIQEKLKVAYQQKKENEGTLSFAEQDYYSFKSEILEVENLIRTLNKQRNEMQSLINGLKEKHNELRYELTTIIERISVEFNVESEVLRQVVLPEAEMNPALETEIKQLKNKLDTFGEVNPMAVSAYKEISERFVEINTQREDILKAKIDLENTIAEIEETATVHFLDAFSQVRESFIEVFRSLFTEEDDCDMKLENPDLPLESNIIITAKPKGKKPQSLSQLSGGEKTLTATALLFALYLLKPAPFCIFDEVDAPLDDANIEKFNKIIKKFSKDSQFIIITHNKLTMTEVDVIYGVYMEEMGISAVSPVDFRNYEHQNFLETLN